MEDPATEMMCAQGSNKEITVLSVSSFELKIKLTGSTKGIVHSPYVGQFN